MIRLFVGCAPNGEDAESMSVLEYSVRTNTPVPVDIVWMKHSLDPASPYHDWSSGLWATPFSGFRWTIPEVCGFKGKAIYCDSDFIFKSDLQGLWNQEFEPGKVIMAKGGTEGWRYCCSMWNCEVAADVLLPIARMKGNNQAHARLSNMFASSPELVQQFQGNWNCIDGEDKQLDQIDGLHYSSMSHQFHLSQAIPRLKAEGRTHWFDGDVIPHWRTDLQGYYGMMYELAQRDYPISRYIPDVTTAFRMASNKGYGSIHQAHQWVK